MKPIKKIVFLDTYNWVYYTVNKPIRNTITIEMQTVERIQPLNDIITLVFDDLYNRLNEYKVYSK